MDLILDSDVRAVAEFMHQNMAAARLVAIARGIAALAPLLWGHYEAEEVSVLRLEQPPIVEPGAGPARSNASG